MGLYVLIILFCSLLSVDARANSSDTTFKSKGKLVKSKIRTKSNKVLIVVDGVIFKGDLSEINPNDISNVVVLKNPGATNIYGPVAANGAILITTKNNRKVETTTVKRQDSIFSRLVFVIDGIASTKEKLVGIDPHNVLIFDNSQIKKDTVVIVTKVFATQQYQNRFSTFSKKYKDYIASHQNNDEDFLYVLDGVQVQGKRDDIIKTLYKIPSEKIKEIGFNEKQATDGSATVVIINTK